MSSMPPKNDNPDEIDAKYLRWSAADPARPSELIGAAVLAHAARLAADRQAAAIKQKSAYRSIFRWKAPVFAALAAAAFTGLLVAPRVFTPNTTRVKPDTHVAASEVMRDAARAPAPAPAPSEPVKAPSEFERIIVTASKKYSRQDSSAVAAPSAPPVDRGAALRRSADAGDAAGVSALLGERIDIESRDSAGRTALMLAVLGGRASVVTVLLAQGADPNATDAYGETPLHAALVAGHSAIASALQHAGAR